MTEPLRIPLSECKHGGLYRIHSRNLRLGVFKEGVKGFVGIREKFSHLYLFTEFHWDTGPPFGTVNPKEFLEDCPITDLDEHHFPEGKQCCETNKPLFDWLMEKERQYGCRPGDERP